MKFKVYDATEERRLVRERLNKFVQEEAANEFHPVNYNVTDNDLELYLIPDKQLFKSFKHDLFKAFRGVRLWTFILYFPVVLVAFLQFWHNMYYLFDINLWRCVRTVARRSAILIPKYGLFLYEKEVPDQHLSRFFGLCGKAADDGLEAKRETVQMIGFNQIKSFELRKGNRKDDEVPSVDKYFIRMTMEYGTGKDFLINPDSAQETLDLLNTTLRERKAAQV
eukprot:augustus_masked-scaffold_14-processed-gene-2.2-mRNA-1 protein AED:1.00 eAED:1.00 QI:0/-1/0/0/-1/1/1/0/222